MVDTPAAAPAAAAAAAPVAPAAGTAEAAAAAAAASLAKPAAAAVVDPAAAKTDDKPAAATSLIGDAPSADKNGHDPAAQAAADKAAADKVAADKVAEDKAAADKAWKPADLKLPEGFTADDKGLATFHELGTKHGIGKEAAQALMDIYVDQLKAGNEAAANLWNTMQTDNQAKMKADPDFGGAKLDASLQLIAKVIDDPRYGGEDRKAIKEALGLTGAGNHPAIFRFLSRISKALTEGKQVTGQAPTTARDPAKTLYPNLPG